MADKEFDMIQERTILKVVDNSGAKVIRCFRILGGSRKRYAQIGDIIVASVRKVEPRKAIKKKDVVRAVIVRQKKKFKRKGGIYIYFDESAAVLIDEKKELRGTRIFGPVPLELKNKGFENIINLAKEVV